MVSYKRITKPNARKMYNHGCDILLLPCKVSNTAIQDKSPWIKPVTINILNCEHEVNKFDRTINDYEYYNCNAELGYYAHYFVSEEELEKYNMCQLMCN